MRLEQRGEQVVRGADRVDVAREVQVEVLHRDDLRVPASRGAALIPNTAGEASRRQSTGRRPIAPSPCVSETDVVVFPSPALVGVIAVTQTSFPSGRSASRSSTERSIFALWRP